MKKAQLRKCNKAKSVFGYADKTFIFSKPMATELKKPEKLKKIIGKILKFNF